MRSRERITISAVLFQGPHTRLLACVLSFAGGYRIAPLRDTYDYLEFEIGDEKRFERLLSMFGKLRRLKERYPHPLPADLRGIQDDPTWMDYLDEEAVDWFCNTRRWDFENTLYWIGDGNFRLIELRKEEGGKGVLFYELTEMMDDATPLTPLLEAFGNRVVYDSRFGQPPYSWMD
jgi:hypothetical protein